MELTVYDRQKDASEGVRELAMAIAKSGMFNCDNDSQAYIIAMECFVRRCSPIEIMTRFHVIKGKLSVKAGVMLADAQRYGWRHRVLSRTPELASLQLIREDEQLTFSLSWESAKQEPFVYDLKEAEAVKQLAAGRTPQLKPKYSTPRARMQMLWARVVTDAITACCPQAASGCQAPEIVDDYDDEEPVQQQASTRKRPQAKVWADKPAEPITSQPIAPAIEAAKPIETLPATITDQQIAELRSLTSELGLSPATLRKIIDDAGADRLEGLSRQAAADIAAKLHEMLAKRNDDARAEADAEREAIQAVEAGEVVDATFEIMTEEPATASEDQVKQIKTLVMELAQVPEYADTVAKVKAAIQRMGLEKVADLSYANARSLIVALEKKQLAAWVAEMIPATA